VRLLGADARRRTGRWRALGLAQHAVELMAVYTDRPAAATRLLSPAPAAGSYAAIPRTSRPGSRLLEAVFSGTSLLLESPADVPGWTQVLIRNSAPASQYDLLIQLLRAHHPIPDGTACLAVEGANFHGFRGRTWSALPGNIHLAAHLAPSRRIEQFATVFTALAAVSLVEAIQGLPELHDRVAIKWVNDILVDGAKVGGVLAHTQSSGQHVDAVVLGLGLNVEATPRVDRSAFVPKVGSLRDFVKDPGSASVSATVRLLLRRLSENYRSVLAYGHVPIMDKYRSYSAVVGEEVTICSEPESRPTRIIAAGRVRAVGDNMELYIAGRPEPVTNGRLLLGTIGPEALNE
jgi:biotin-[acetyl-CoA-carboxylase] ligase BirA-like protein